MSAIAEKFRADLAHTLNTWKLDMIPPRPDFAPTMAIFRDGLSDLARMRLIVAYGPILCTLERMQKQLDILADAMRRPDPYAPPPVFHRAPMQRIETR